MDQQKSFIHRNDVYCFECHRPNEIIECQTCPRVYHRLCARLTSIPQSNWICPECESIQSSFHIINRNYSLTQLRTMLRYIVNRLKSHPQAEYFLNWKYSSDVNDYIIYPMNFDLIERNLNEKHYSSTESFLRDIKWIVHNTSIYNGSQHKLTQIARIFLKITRYEISEIELCSECYIRRIQSSTIDWFIKACSIPHTLCWTKMKNDQLWPAKVLRIVNDEVDVWLFGKHDRAKITHRNCFVLSKDYPETKFDDHQFEKSLVELHEHIEELKRIYGEFFYAPSRTLLSRIKSFRFVSAIDNSISPSYMTNNYQISRKRSRDFDDELQSSFNVFDIFNQSEQIRSISPSDNKYHIQALIQKYVSNNDDTIIIDPDVRLLMNDLLDSIRTKKPRKSNKQHRILPENSSPTVRFVPLRALSVSPPPASIENQFQSLPTTDIDTQSSITIETNVWPSILSIESPKKKSKIKQQNFLPTISHTELAFDDRQIRDEIQTTIHNFQSQFQQMLVNFTNQIDSILRSTQTKYEKDLAELHSITTERVEEIRNTLELQYWTRLSEMRHRYESKVHYSMPLN